MRRSRWTYKGLIEALKKENEELKKEKEGLKKENEGLKKENEYNEYKGLDCNPEREINYTPHVNLNWYLIIKYECGYSDVDGHIYHDFDFIDENTKKSFYKELCDNDQYLQNLYDDEYEAQSEKIESFMALFDEYVDDELIIFWEKNLEKIRKQLYWLLEKKKAFNKIQNLIMLKNYI